LKQIIFKTEGVAGSLQSLLQEFPGIKLAFIYGSYARGEETASSDIDVLIVGEPDDKELTSKVMELERRLGRQINFNVYQEPEYKKKSREKGSFLAEVVEGKKVMLKGRLRA
jgi:predicted nucleotidyltransferase